MEIPKEMIEAAIPAIKEAIFRSAYISIAARDAHNAAVFTFEAAGVPALVERIADYEESYRRVVVEQCAPDERHCTCVPALRQRIAELEAEKAQRGAGGEE